MKAIYKLFANAIICSKVLYRTVLDHRLLRVQVHLHNGKMVRALDAQETADLQYVLHRFAIEPLFS